MPSDRFFASFKEEDQTIFIKEKEFHHLFRVMRAKPGDKIEIINGKGSLAQGEVQTINKETALISITSIKTEKKEPPFLILAQAIPKLALLEWIIEKGCELNVNEFWLFPGERSEKKEINIVQLERLKAITLAATKQCGRLWIPSIVIHPALKKWEKSPHTLLFGDLHPKAPTILELKHTKEEICLVIGPEKGFAQTEIDTLQNLEAIGIKLHKNILRTETASIAALAQLYLI